MTGDPADLANLRDIVLPPPISLWPPAPGWWILAAAILAGALILLAKALALYRRNAYRPGGVARTGRDRSGCGAADFEGAEARRARGLPARRGGALSGEAWLAFLDRTGGTSAFTAGPARGLASLAFGAAPAANGAAIAGEARRWVRQHRGPVEPGPC